MVTKIQFLGWMFIISSCICMYFSMQERDYSATFIWWLFAARLCGISGFVCGVVCIFQKKWNHGSLLIASAVVLPLLSLLIHSRM